MLARHRSFFALNSAYNRKYIDRDVQNTVSATLTPFERDPACRSIVSAENQNLRPPVVSARHTSGSALSSALRWPSSSFRARHPSALLRKNLVPFVAQPRLLPGGANTRLRSLRCAHLHLPWPFDGPVRLSTTHRRIPAPSCLAHRDDRHHFRQRSGTKSEVLQAVVREGVFFQIRVLPSAIVTSTSSSSTLVNETPASYIESNVG